MKTYIVRIAGCVLAMSAACASASEVLVTNINASKGGDGGALAIDVVSDGKVAGFSFRIDIPGVIEKSVNLKSCVAELPKGFQGGCSVVKGSIFVIASSDSANVAIPQGVAKVGTIYYKRSGTGAIQVVGAEFSDNSANSVAGAAKVLAD